jgi:hypothetical protein
MSLPTVNEWADFMPQTVLREPWLSYKSGGSDSNYDTAISYLARIEMKNHLIVGKDGKVITARGKVFILSSTIPNIKDRWTLPSGYIPTQPPVLDVNVVDDESGNHHVTLELG